MEKVTLFKLETESIKISMQLYFNEKNQLYFDGYDIGKTVKDAWGDSNYEYCYIIEPIEVEKLYQIYGINLGQKAALLNAIKNHFNGNKAYSQFGEFMKKNKIEYSSSTWA